MFRFGKKKRYSIGEKIKYFNGIRKDPNASQKKKTWAARRLNALNKTRDNMKVGDVFVVNDQKMGNPNKKPRVVVVAKKGKQKVSVLALRKSGKIMTFSNFDGQRKVDFNYSKELGKGSLYETRGFKITQNAYLTREEKDRLQKKADQYL